MHKNEAEKLVDLGLVAIQAHDFDKAIALLQKSLNVQHSENAAKLLKKAKTLKKQYGATEILFSVEEEEVSKAVIAKTNYYDILDIPLTASQSDIKKAYRKLVLKFHPDKNSCPSAADAFKKIAKAYKCLIDEEKKSYYDTTGQDEDSAASMENFFSNFSITVVVLHFLEDTILSPAHFLHRGFKGESTGECKKSSMLVTIAPLLMLVILAFASSLLSKGAAEYSVISTPYYNSYRTTGNMKIEYYANYYFIEKLSDAEVNSIEVDIEQEYIAELNKQCEQIRGLKQNMQNLSKKTNGYNSKILENFAASLDTSCCTRLEELISLY